MRKLPKLSRIAGISLQKKKNYFIPPCSREITRESPLATQGHYGQQDLERRIEYKKPDAYIQWHLQHKI